MTKQHRLLVAHGAYYAVSKAAPGLAGILITVLVARSLSTRDYGSFSSVVILSSALATVCTGWLRQGILRIHSGDAGIAPSTVASILIATILSCAVAGLVVSAAYLIPKFSDMLQLGTAPMATIAAVSSGGFLVLISLFSALLRPREIMWAEAIRAALNIAWTVGFALLGWLCLQTAILAVSVGSMAVVLIAVSRMPQSLRLAFRQIRTILAPGGALHAYWTTGAVMTIWLLISLMLPLVERTIVSSQLGPARVGEYAVVYDLVFRSFALLLFPVTAAAHPLIMAAYRTAGMGEAGRAVRRSVTISVLLFLPAVVVMYFAGGVLMAKAVPATTSLSELAVPLAVSAFLWQVGLLIHKPLECVGAGRQLVACIGLSFSVDAIATWMLVPTLNLMGAVVGSMLGATSYIVCAIACSGRVSRDAR